MNVNVSQMSVSIGLVNEKGKLAQDEERKDHGGNFASEDIQCETQSRSS
jgi:hypothetical protein